ncbi:MAG: cache domain-containing protein [Gammaproteobacteria bacterium]|nr:cache domain-containing protein [Gammaproteobacteria bacterium]
MTKNIFSFVRLWKPDKSGDDLRGFRETIVEVKNTQKPFVAIETGRAGLVLRGLSPIIDQGQYLGSVEFMQGLNSIIRDGKKKDINIVILMKKDYMKVATLLKNKPELNNDFVLASKEADLDQTFFAELQDQDITSTGQTDSYFYTSSPITDFKGNIASFREILAQGLLFFIELADNGYHGRVYRESVFSVLFYQIIAKPLQWHL